MEIVGEVQSPNILNWYPFKENQKIKEIKKQTKISYNSTGLLKGKTYYYKVMAYRNMSGIYVYGKYSTVKQIRK